MRILSHRTLFIVLLLISVLILVSVACSNDDETKDNNDYSTSATFAIDPSITESGSEVTVTAEGMALGDSIDVRVLLEGESSPVGVTYSINPTPEIDASGAFSGILKLKGFPVGTHTAQLIVNGELASEVTIQITDPSA